MKASGGWVLAIAFGAVILGCATGGNSAEAAQADNAPVQAGAPQAAGAPVQTDASQAPSAPAPSAAPVAPVAAAAIPEENGKPVVRADTAENFAAVVASIHQQMQPLGRWQYIDQQERGTIDRSFADMQLLYDKFGSVDKMDQAARTQLLADQNTVNAILTRRDGDRLVCRNELPVGSHLPVKTCKSYAQIQAEQSGAQELLRQQGARERAPSGH